MSSGAAGTAPRGAGWVSWFREGEGGGVDYMGIRMMRTNRMMRIQISNVSRMQSSDSMLLGWLLKTIGAGGGAGRRDRV